MVGSVGLLGCRDKLIRHVTLPCHYFQAWLNYRPKSPLQKQFFFEDQSYRSEVGRRWFKDARGRTFGKWPEMEVLASAFPKAKTPIEASGVLYSAMKEGCPRMQTIDTILDIHLPQPVCVVTRPDVLYKSKLYLQVVPIGFEDWLMDDYLRAQRN